MKYHFITSPKEVEIVFLSLQMLNLRNIPVRALVLVTIQMQMTWVRLQPCRKKIAFWT